MSATHTSVLLEQVISALAIKKNKKYLDATYGAGGHSKEIYKNGARVLALDADEEVVKGYEQPDPNAPILIWGNFRNLREIALHHGFAPVEGVVYDLGLSMMQLANQKRGFSYRFPSALLDGKIDPHHPSPNMAKILNTYSLIQLTDILIKYSGSLEAQKIARNIIKKRKQRAFKIVADLLEVIKESVGVNIYLSELKKVFQALRIEANEEFQNLQISLSNIGSIINTGGRIAIISFHQDEDRLVKKIFEKLSDQYISLTPKAVKDKAGNKFARSALLRIYQKV